MRRKLISLLLLLLLPTVVLAQDGSNWTCDNGPNDVLNAANTAYAAGDYELAYELASIAETLCGESGNAMRYVEASGLLGRLEREHDMVPNPPAVALQLEGLPPLGLAALDVHLLATFDFQRMIFATWSPDGTLLAMADDDSNIWLHPADQLARPSHVLEGHTNAVLGLDFSPDGTLLASGGADETVRLWQLSDESSRALYTHTATIISVAFSPDGRWLASGGMDGRVKIWDLQANRLLHSFENPGVIFEKVAFRADSQQIAGLGDDGIVRLWEVVTGENQTMLTVREGNISDIAYSPDGSQIVLTSTEFGDEAIFYDTHTFLAGRLLEYDSRVSNITFTPDGAFMLVFSNNHIAILDARNGLVRSEIRVSTTNIRFWAMEVNPAGTVLMTVDHLGHLQLWAAHPDSEIIEPPALAPERVVSLAGRPVITADNAISLRSIYHRPVDDFRYFATFSPDDSTLAASGAGDILLLATDNLASSANPRLLGPRGIIETLAYHPDGSILASGGEDNVIHLWDTATNHERGTLVGHRRTIVDLEFSPDGTLLASCDEVEVRIWDVASGELLLVLNSRYATQKLAFHPNGYSLATGGGGQEGALVMLWRIPTGKAIAVLNGDGARVNDLTFSPDGNRLVAALTYAPLTVWDTSDLQALVAAPVVRRTSEFDNVFSSDFVLFSPDGSLLFINSSDSISIFDWQSQRLINAFTVAGAIFFRSFELTHNGHALAGAHLAGMNVWAVVE